MIVFYVQKSMNEDTKNQCCICMSEMTDGTNITITQCGHRFHTSCIISWGSKNNTCPFCREQLYVDVEQGNETQDQRQPTPDGFTLTYSQGPDGMIHMTPMEYKNLKCRMMCYSIVVTTVTYFFIGLILST